MFVTEVVKPDARRRGMASSTPSHLRIQLKLAVGRVDDPFEREAERAADSIAGARLGNAWRLENAVLVKRGTKPAGKRDSKAGRKGDPDTDLFLGHGSGYRTGGQLRAKLAEEFHKVWTSDRIGQMTTAPGLLALRTIECR